MNEITITRAQAIYVLASIMSRHPDLIGGAIDEGLDPIDMIVKVDAVDTGTATVGETSLGLFTSIVAQL